MRAATAATAVLAVVVAATAPSAAAPSAATAEPARSMTAVDATFGGGVLTPSLAPGNDEGRAVAVQADGSVVVAGQANWVTGASEAGLFVRRYTAGGAVDAAFGQGGTVVLDSERDDEAWALSIQPDGRVLVAGTYGGGAAVVRLTTAGLLDTTFQGGIVRLPVGWSALAVAVEPTGRIVVATVQHVLRLLPDGTLDPSFGQGGQVTLAGVGGPPRLALQGDGGVVVARWLAHPVFSGGPGHYAVVTRLTGGGQLDESFGTGGTVTTTLDTDLVDRGFEVSGVVVQPDGRIGVAGTSFIFGIPAAPPVPDGQPPIPPIRHAGLSQVALVRYLPDGALDRSFAGAGKVRTDIGGQADPDRHHPYAMLVPEGDSRGSAVALDSQGRILVAGLSDQPLARPLVVRYTTAGLLDTTFGRAGALVIDSDRHASALAMAVAPDGRIVVSGRAWDDPPAGTGADLLVARLRPGTSEGSVWAWGWNAVGQVGDGTTAERRTPVKVPGLSGVVSVSAGGYHALALRGDGTVWAWGWNALGQLGDGTTVERRTPVKVPGLEGVVAVSAGGLHSLALGGDGTVWAWGWNAVGQLGDGTTTDRHRPVAIGGLHAVVTISAGLYHSLAVREEGSPWAWGWNAVGQLGDGTTTDRHRPVQSPRFAGHGYDKAAIATSAGGLHSLGIDAVGQLAGWGWDGVGQLQNQNDRTLAASAGAYHTLTLAVDGTVRSAGWNAAGQLGDGSTATRGWSWHIPLVAAPPASAVAAGGYHSLVLGRDRTVWAWGWNAVGQLGSGSPYDSLRPLRVAGLDNVTAISAGAGHSAAIRA